MRLKSALLFILAATPLAAQSSEASSPTRCRTTDTTPACRSWTLFEVSLLTWRGGTKHEAGDALLVAYFDTLGNPVSRFAPDLDGEASITLGRMWNRGAKASNGFGVSLGAYPVLVRVEGRTRLRIRGESSIDLMAGYFERDWSIYHEANAMIGPTVAAALEVSGVGLIARRSIVTNRHPDLTATYLGISAGRGVSPTVVIGLLTLILLHNMGGP